MALVTHDSMPMVDSIDKVPFGGYVPENAAYIVTGSAMKEISDQLALLAALRHVLVQVVQGLERG